MEEKNLLDQIKYPIDLRKLKKEQLKQLSYLREQSILLKYKTLNQI